MLAFSAPKFVPYLLVHSGLRSQTDALVIFGYLQLLQQHVGH